MEISDFKDATLEKVLEGVRQSDEETQKFAADPAAYLQSKGVDTEGLTIGTSELSDDDLEQVAGGQAIQEDLAQVCGSIGCVGCISVG